MHKIIEIFADRAALHTEILALRQQVAVLKRKRPRPLLRKADRVFWVILSCLWPGWRHALVIVRPETVIGWHRKGFRLFWTWKSRRRKPGRPPVSREIRDLVRRMSRENTRWGAPRIHGELLKLGFSISQAAVSKYMVRYPSPPSQSWRTFLTNHADCLASIDFFVVPTATFHLLFGFIVLHHERRQIVHFGVTANPTMAWVAQQIREAFPWGTAPRYLIRDRDGAYGQSFRSTVTAMGVEEVVTAPRSPWQNPYVERLIGSVRRECLDHSIILNERHLRRILGSYLDYYHGSRTHLSLGKDTPDGRPVQPAGSGTVVSLPKVGGLHHRYETPRGLTTRARIRSISLCGDVDATGTRMPLHRFAGTIRRNKHRDDRAHGRLQNPLAQNDVRAGEPSRRWEARWNKWKGQHPPAFHLKKDRRLQVAEFYSARSWEIPPLPWTNLSSPFSLATCSTDQPLRYGSSGDMTPCDIAAARRLRASERSDEQLWGY